MNKKVSALTISLATAVVIGLGVFGNAKYQEYRQLKEVAEKTSQDLSKLSGMPIKDASKINSLSYQCQHGHQLTSEEKAYLISHIREHSKKTPGDSLAASLAYFILRDDVRNKKGTLDADVLTFINEQIRTAVPTSETHARGVLSVLFNYKGSDRQNLIEPLLTDSRENVRQYAKEALGIKKS
jgi:hypothetical protein